MEKLPLQPVSVLITPFRTMYRVQLSLGGTSMDGVAGAPEWTGWLAILALVAGFCALTWWLFFSPIHGHISTPTPSPRMLRVRRVVATLVLVSGTLGAVGARWDELWHRLYGGFGEDFLWPPHLLLYVSLGMNGVYALLGLSFALRGKGDVRRRFRAEPLMGLLGLLAAYQIASIPSDLLWHEIIGPDITAWSLPHLLLALTITAVLLTGVPLALSTAGITGWRGVSERPKAMELVALGLIALGVLNLLQIGTTEWEWIGSAGDASPTVASRPSWAYPLVALLIGSASAHTALHATRHIGAATTVAGLVLLVQVATVAIARATVPPGPLLAAHVFLLPAALALDAWYAASRDRAAASTIAVGAGLYCAAFFVVAFPYMARFMRVPTLDTAARFTTFAIALPVALVAATLAARAATRAPRGG